MPEDGPPGADRRTILKRAGVAGVAVWSAPVVTSLASPALATAGSEPPADTGACITLAAAHSVTAVVSKHVGRNALEFGLAAPRDQEICTGCEPGAGGLLGTFPAGTALLFYLEDLATFCGCVETWTCRDPQHVQVVQDSALVHRVLARDNGCLGCPSTATLEQEVNLEVTVTLGPPAV